MFILPKHGEKSYGTVVRLYVIEFLGRPFSHMSQKMRCPSAYHIERLHASSRCTEASSAEKRNPKRLWLCAPVGCLPAAVEIMLNSTTRYLTFKDCGRISANFCHWHPTQQPFSSCFILHVLVHTSAACKDDLLHLQPGKHDSCKHPY